jgi:NAD(P)-dependent dehydrogenase (short-subunit alcohol dehydrogenase family)
MRFHVSFHQIKNSEIANNSRIRQYAGVKMQRLKDKVAIVTGAGMGLGKAYVIGMAKEGASIVVNDIVPEAATNTVEEIKKADGKAVACIGGVGSIDIAEKLVKTAVTEFGKVDILVNNAGMTRDSRFVKMEEKQWDDVIYVHLRGTFINSQAAVRYMIDHGIKGRIINITSPAGEFGNIGQANYSAAKAGIIGLTKSNARELVRYGICINAISPGAKTAMMEAIPEKIRVNIYAKLASESVVQRMGEPEDVVPTVIFLASDDAYYVTGQVISVMGSTGSM